ncbi:MAG: hypothetical protein DWQ02_14390 [Bacteroidetes bacterium]|nr:MAG: hypothetical protein DWQ02_14390 [Bacteroidota bacterium]
MMPPESKNPNEKNQRELIKNGVEMLQASCNYKQITIVKKLSILGFEISAASLSNILNDRKVGSDALWVMSKGIKKLVAKELGFDYVDRSFQAITKSGWTPEIVSIQEENKKNLNGGVIFHNEGRLDISEKVSFFSNAQSQIIEFGLSLNSFSNYFFTRKEADFKVPIIGLLQRGVDFKCFLLDPECNEARLYFEDRSRFVEEEYSGIEKIKTSIRRFEKMQQEFQNLKYPGKFEVFTYKHIPHNYFLVIDGGRISGKMMVSHYIYGELRANCPVIQFTKIDQRTLYRRYWNSLEKLTKGARKIVG